MPGISYIKRIDGATNNFVYIETSDSTATATASGYITAQTANITSINEGVWTWETNDAVMLSASDGISWCSIDSSFTTLTVFASSLPIAVSVDTGVTAYAGGGQTNAVLLTGKWNNVTTVATAGDSVKLTPSVVGISQVVTNSGANPMQVFGSGTDTINGIATATGVLQAVGTSVEYRCDVAGNFVANLVTIKGTGSVTSNAVTINAIAGVITTGSLATASGAAATATTLTNDFITSSSVILCQVQGGTNTTDGINIIATPGSGTASIVLFNNNVSGTALNGTVIYSFLVI